MVVISIPPYHTVLQKAPKKDNKFVLNSFILELVLHKYYNESWNRINGFNQISITSGWGETPLQAGLETNVNIHFVPPNEDLNLRAKKQVDSYRAFREKAFAILDEGGRVLLDVRGVITPHLRTTKYERQYGLQVGDRKYSARSIEALVVGNLKPMLFGSESFYDHSRFIIDDPKVTVMDDAARVYMQLIGLIFDEYHVEFSQIASIAPLVNEFQGYNYEEPHALVWPTLNTGGIFARGLNVIMNLVNNCGENETYAAKKEKLSLRDRVYLGLIEPLEEEIAGLRQELIGRGVDMDYLNQVRLQ